MWPITQWNKGVQSQGRRGVGCWVDLSQALNSQWSPKGGGRFLWDLTLQRTRSGTPQDVHPIRILAPKFDRNSTTRNLVEVEITCDRFDIKKRHRQVVRHQLEPVRRQEWDSPHPPSTLCCQVSHQVCRRMGHDKSNDNFNYCKSRELITSKLRHKSHKILITEIQ